jgi:signal transduction histidine kinase
MARVSDGCATWHFSAARVKLSSSQTARKYLTWCISMRRLASRTAARPGPGIAAIYQIESQMILAAAVADAPYAGGSDRPSRRAAGACLARRTDLTSLEASRMTQFTLAACNPALSPALSEQWAHDIRNTLATIGLHLERLQQLSGPGGAKAAHAALALVSRGAGMCSDAMVEARMPRPPSRRRGFDIVKTIKDVAALLEPTAPAGFEFRFECTDPHIVLGDQTEVFRILFNLAQNAVSVARRGARMSHVRFAIARNGTGVTVRVTDDGPGLPKAVKANLFRSPAPSGATSGFGLAIARELAERNGARLSIDDGTRGASFVLDLPHAAGREIAYGAAMPSLGRRIAS